MKKLLSRSFSIKHIERIELSEDGKLWLVTCFMASGNSIESVYNEERRAREFYESVSKLMAPFVKNQGINEIQK